MELIIFKSNSHTPPATDNLRHWYKFFFKWW